MNKQRFDFKVKVVNTEYNLIVLVTQDVEEVLWETAKCVSPIAAYYPEKNESKFHPKWLVGRPCLSRDEFKAQIHDYFVNQQG